MISDDIVKKIKFVFAGDNKDLKKTLDETNKAAASLAKNFDLGKQSAVLDKFIKNLSGTNKELTKTMQGVSKGFKDIAEKDFDKFTKKVEGAYKALQETQRKIETAQRAGDTASVQRLKTIQGYQAKNVNNNMQAANSAASAAGIGQGGSGSLLSQFGNLTAYAGTGYAAIRSLSTIPNFARSAGEMGINNQAQLASLSRNNLGRYLAGDLSQEYVMGKNNGAASSEIEAALGQGAASRMVGSGIMGGMKGAWSTFSNNPLALFDQNKMAAGFEAGARSDYSTTKAKDRQDLINKRVSNSIDPMYLQSIGSNAANRFSMQSSFGGMSDTMYGMNLDKLKGSRMSEADMVNYSMQNRTAMGSYAAANLTNAPGLIRNTTGMSMDVSNSLMQSANMSGKGGGLEKEQVIAMFARGFENGIKDSGLLEGILKGSATIAQSFGSRIDMARMTGDIANVANLVGDGARGMQGTLDAKNFYENMSGSNDEMGLHKQAYAVEVTKHIKNRTAREAMRNYISSKKPEEIKQLAGNEEFLTSAAANGATPEELSALTSKTSSNLFEESQLGMTAPGRKLRADIESYAKNNNVSKAEATRRLSLIRTGQLTGNYGTDASRTAMGSFLTGNRETPVGGTFDPMALGKGMNNTQSGFLTNITANRQNEFASTAMAKTDTADLEAATVSQNQTYRKTGGTMGLGGSISDLVAALEQFAQALNTNAGANTPDWTKKAGGQ